MFEVFWGMFLSILAEFFGGLAYFYVLLLCVMCLCVCFMKFKDTVYRTVLKSNIFSLFNVQSIM